MVALRRIEPEILDTLPENDPLAVGSRRDLRRINAWMLQSRLMARLLTWCGGSSPPRLLIELGGGDGTFMVGVARRMARRWPRVTVVSVDRQNLVGEDTLRSMASIGWRFEAVVADVFDFLSRERRERPDIVVANLFLHHFAPESLSRLLAGAASSSRAFAACEPRRAMSASMASRLVFAVGCNAVTRHDSVASVRAGFRGRELSAIWPDPARWHLREGPALPFTHCFAARRDV